MSGNPFQGLPFNHLQQYQERRFVPESANLRNKEEVVVLFEKLLQREIQSGEELEQWLLDRSECEAALDQEQAILYINMTCQTDNADFSEAYKHFIETVIPAVQPIDDKLNRRFLSMSERFPLDPSRKDRYKVYTRAVRTDIEIFREANVPLKTQVDLLSQDYQTVCGAMTVEFQGKEKTLPQMSKFLEDPDRELRESAWRSVALRRQQDRDRLDELFEKMLVLRNQIADNAGFSNFCEYQFRSYHRFDYTIDDCKQYHKTMEDLGLPVLQKLLHKRQEQMNLDRLRPWDTVVDPQGRPALKPFVKVEDLIGGVKDIFKKVDADFGSQFAEMAQLRLLDLASRKGKAPGGYQNTLAEARKPFIFMNAVGVDEDVWTLLHEGGHSFHALASAQDPLHDYRHAPMEFCEVASMSLELLGGEYLDTFYSPEEIMRSRESHFEDIIRILIWVANIDAFQHWIYENPKHNREDRTKAWLDIHHRFGGDLIDWQGLEGFHAGLWHRQLHIFEVPFYYIEYGIAQLGALQIWLNARTGASSKRDSQQNITKFREALSLGGSRPLPELFSTAGIKFDFSKNTIAPLLEAVKKELNL